MKKNNRTVLLTGATGKFGRVFAAHLLASGHTLVATGRSATSLTQLQDELRGQGLNLDHFYGIEADFSRADAIDQVISHIKQFGLGIEILINNARSLAHLKTGADGMVSRHDFTQEYVIDVVVPYELTMRLALLASSSLTQVVNIGSQYGAVAANLALYDNPHTDSPIQYSVAKAALVHLTKELAVRLATRQIQVNCISFGGVEGRVSDAFKQRFSALSPIGRMLGADDLVAPLEMLLSNPGLSLTGHTLHADGGWSLW